MTLASCTPRETSSTTRSNSPMRNSPSLKRHPGDGADMLAAVGDAEIAAMVRHHHERMDGHGYPDRPAGSDIPLGARIIAVADTFDAITSSRAYRPACVQKRALDILSEEAGSQLDAVAVAAFFRQYSARRSVAWFAFDSSSSPSASSPDCRLVSTELQRQHRECHLDIALRWAQRACSPSPPAYIRTSSSISTYTACPRSLDPTGPPLRRPRPTMGCGTAPGRRRALRPGITEAMRGYEPCPAHPCLGTPPQAHQIPRAPRGVQARVNLASRPHHHQLRAPRHPRHPRPRHGSTKLPDSPHRRSALR